MDICLEIEGITKNFGNMKALNDVSLKVERGSFVCLLGPSGCGKTTLLRIIAGFQRADAGRLLLDGTDISEVPPHKRDFGMVFQSLALFPHMTVAENIAYGLKLRKVNSKKRRDRVEELLTVIDLPSIADRPVSDLSGGQRQRVAIARALAVQPKIFLLDEPLSALDAQLRDNMQIELRQLQQKFGVTTILVTHDQTEAMMLADNLVVLKNGEISQSGPPSDVYRNPDDPFVAEFLGAANLLSGTASNRGRVKLLGIETEIPTNSMEGTLLDVSIRAENIDLLSPENANGYPIGNIEFIRDLGAVTELIVAVDDRRVRIRSNTQALRDTSIGQKVGLSFDPAQCGVFER